MDQKFGKTRDGSLAKAIRIYMIFHLYTDMISIKPHCDESVAG